MSLLGWQVSVPVLGIMGCSPFSAGDGSKSCLHLNILPSRPSAKASRAPSAADIPNTTSSHQPQNSCHLSTIPGDRPWGGMSRGTHPSSVPTCTFPALGTLLFPLATTINIFLPSTFTAPLCCHVQHHFSPVPFCPESANQEDFRNLSCTATFSPSSP